MRPNSLGLLFIGLVVCALLGCCTAHEFLFCLCTRGCALVGDISIDGRTILCLLFSSCLLCDHTPNTIRETIATEDIIIAIIPDGSSDFWITVWCITELLLSDEFILFLSILVGPFVVNARLESEGFCPGRCVVCDV